MHIAVSLRAAARLIGLASIAAGPCFSTAVCAQAAADDDGPAIQAQIDAAAKQGGGVVQLAARTYRIARPLYLRDGVTLAGAGPATTITNVGLNSRDDWAGAVVYAGNLVPLAFTVDSYGFPGHAARRVGDKLLELPGCGSTVPARG
ncbi:MAG: hypothetical protein J2O44_01515, partial [Porphyrobacter sp.]|nr:hypothetical protein [Porphyrobacter sp.]